jgi:hypothetical protein
VAGVVAITDCDHGNVDPERAALGGHDVELRVLACRTPEEVAAQAGDADVLINQYVPITGEVLDALPRCRLVVRYGVGVDNVDVAAATERGVWVANVPGYGRDEVADHTLALALSLLRGVVVLDRSVREGDWDLAPARPLRRLSTLTWGVVGCGAIGTAVAHRAAGLGMRVLGYDLPQVPSGPPIERVGLEGLLEVADLVSLHAALTPESHHLIGAAALGRMRPTAFPGQHRPGRAGRHRRPADRPGHREAGRGRPRRPRGRASRRPRLAGRPPPPGRGHPARRLVLRGGVPHPQDRRGPRSPPGPAGQHAPFPGQHPGAPPMTPPRLLATARAWLP